MTSMEKKQEKQNKEKNELSIIDYGITQDINYKTLEKVNEWEEFVSFWLRSREVENCIRFMRGDLVNRLVAKYGEGSVARFAKDVSEKEQTLIAYRRVARAFPSSKRNLNLTWTHYLIASQTDSWDKGTSEFKTNNRFKWLDRANDENLSTFKLVKEIKESKDGVSRSSTYEYSEGYIKKFREILLHLDKSKLSESEKKRLLDLVEDLDIEFKRFIET